MHRRRACLFAICSTCTHAQIGALAPPQQVVISGAQTDVDAGQDFVAGNLALRPERSLGLHLSYAHGLGRDSEVSLELHARDISDKNGLEVALADVS